MRSTIIRPTREDVLAVLRDGTGRGISLTEVAYEVGIARGVSHADLSMSADIPRHVSVHVTRKVLDALVASGEAAVWHVRSRGRNAARWGTADQAEKRAAARAQDHARTVQVRAEKWAAAELVRLHGDEFAALVAQYTAENTENPEES